MAVSVRKPDDVGINIEVTDVNKQGSLPISLARFEINQESKDYVSYARKAKFILTISFITTATILLILDLNIYKTIFAFCCVYFIVQFVGTLVIISSAKSLHWIEIEIIGIYGYRIFCVPNKVIQKYNTTIKSISDLSALPGSITHNMMLIGPSMVYSLSLIAIIVKEREWKENQNEDRLMIEWISIYLAFIGNTGLFLIGLWWLETDNKFSAIMHYSGATSFLILVSAAFVLYQQFSVFSIILACLQFITTILWFILMIKCPNQDKDRHKVHRISFWCILSELIAVLIAGLNGACFVWCMDGDIILFSSLF